VLPSFVQTADAQTTLDPIGVIGVPIDDPWGDWDGWVDDDWGCQKLGCEPSDDGGGGSSGDSNNNYDPVVCNNLTTGTNNPNYVPGNPNAPLWCVTDPGTSLQVNYNTFINDYLGAILGDLNGPCTSGCFWSNIYPYMTEQLASSAINLFGDAFYNSYDYLSSRNAIWYTLTRTCEITYSNSLKDQDARNEFNSCMDSQADFLYSMTPINTSSSSSWSGSLGYQAPWGGTISFNFGGNSSSGNWVSDFLILVNKTRSCHNWYQALEAANCPNP